MKTQLKILKGLIIKLIGVGLAPSSQISRIFIEKSLASFVSWENDGNKAPMDSANSVFVER